MTRQDDERHALAARLVNVSERMERLRLEGNGERANDLAPFREGLVEKLYQNRVAHQVTSGMVLARQTYRLARAS